MAPCFQERLKAIRFLMEAACRKSKRACKKMFYTLIYVDFVCTMVSYEEGCDERQCEVVVADDITEDNKEPLGLVDMQFVVPHPAP